MSDFMREISKTIVEKNIQEVTKDLVESIADSFHYGEVSYREQIRELIRNEIRTNEEIKSKIKSSILECLDKIIKNQ